MILFGVQVTKRATGRHTPYSYLLISSISFTIVNALAIPAIILVPGQDITFKTHTHLGNAVTLFVWWTYLFIFAYSFSTLCLRCKVSASPQEWKNGIGKVAVDRSLLAAFALLAVLQVSVNTLATNWVIDGVISQVSYR